MNKCTIRRIENFLQIILLANWAILIDSFDPLSNKIGQFSRSPKGIQPERRLIQHNQWPKPFQHREHLTTLRHHPIGLYVHIPYCRRRCRYCNFSIVPIGNRVSTNPSKEENENNGIYSGSDLRANRGFQAMNNQYERALLAELQRVSDSISQSGNDKIPLQSIYFGGGTPSLAPIETIESILKCAIGENGPFVLVDGRNHGDDKGSSTAEISIEMDPGTFTTEKLQQLKDIGFNRISLGVQSFDDTILECMGRFHRKSDVFAAVKMIHEVFGEEANYSIDLISGVPGLTLAKWAETLQIATTQLSPKPLHMSVYDLQIERGTVFSSWYQQNQAMPTGTSSDHNRTLPLPTDDECAFMYKYTAGYLKSKKYEHYEVSSYAFRGTKDGEGNRSKHNQIYWAPSGSWYAIGVGATSFIDGRLVSRPRTLAEYYEWLLNAEESSLNNDSESEESLSDDELLTDLVMKRLRTIDGLDLKWVEDRFGKESASTILEGAALGLDMGLAEYDLGTGILRLKDPEGLLFSNSIISSIFAAL